MKFTVAMRYRALPFFALLAACSGAAKDCTTIGCVDAVVVRGPNGVDGLSNGTLTVCVEDECKDTSFESGVGVNIAKVQFPGMDAGARVTAVLAMPGGTRYEDEVEATRNRPNGPSCGPVCIDADLTFSP